MMRELFELMLDLGVIREGVRRLVDKRQRILESRGRGALRKDLFCTIEILMTVVSSRDYLVDLRPEEDDGDTDILNLQDQILVQYGGICSDIAMLHSFCR
jgi:hypothetical protein